MVDGELLTAIIFYVVLAVLIYKYRKKFTIMYKIFVVYKTQRGTNLMRKLAKFRGFWKVFSTLAIPVAVYSMLWIGTKLWDNMINIIAGTSGAGVALAIPGVRIPGSPIFIPFWFGIISIAVLAVVHEFSHGIVAAVEGVRIKSTGFGFLAVLPLAFVELDEEQMKEMPKLSRIRILAAGSFANVSVYFVLIMFLGFVFSPFVSTLIAFNGVNVTSVVEDQPAAIAGLASGSIITAVNGYEALQLTDFIEGMSEVQPGDAIEIETSEGSFTVETAADPTDESKPYLGVFLEQLSSPTKEAEDKYGFFLPVILWFHDLFWWVATLNLLIGVMNFLPIWALDGSRIAYDLVGYLIKNEKILLLVMNLVFAFFLTLLLFNLVGPAFF